MAQFMLLLYDNPTDWRAVSPEEMQKAIEKYFAWAKLPFVVGSERLTEDPGKVLRAAAPVTDGPYSESKEVLGGYYTIEADDFAQAAERAKTHPHLEYGGVIVVRQVWK